MNRILSAILLLLAVAGMQSCQRNDNPEPAKQQVDINITRPLPADVFHSGDTVHVDGTVQANGSLHGYTLQVFNKDNGKELMAAEYHQHGSSFSFSEKWKDTVTAAAGLELRVTVVVDHDGNTAKKSVFFQSLP